MRNHRPRWIISLGVCEETIDAFLSSVIYRNGFNGRGLPWKMASHWRFRATSGPRYQTRQTETFCFNFLFLPLSLWASQKNAIGPKKEDHAAATCPPMRRFHRRVRLHWLFFIPAALLLRLPSNSFAFSFWSSLRFPDWCPHLRPRFLWRICTIVLEKLNRP